MRVLSLHNKIAHHTQVRLTLSCFIWTCKGLPITPPRGLAVNIFRRKLKRRPSLAPVLQTLAIWNGTYSPPYNKPAALEDHERDRDHPLGVLLTARQFVYTGSKQMRPPTVTRSPCRRHLSDFTVRFSKFTVER